jgi:hypothetical protein
MRGIIKCAMARKLVKRAQALSEGAVSRSGDGFYSAAGETVPAADWTNGRWCQR